MRRAKFKFPGRQKIVVSRNWGFTKYNRDDYVLWKQEGRLVNDGNNAKVRIYQWDPLFLLCRFAVQCVPHQSCERTHLIEGYNPDSTGF